jgi:arylsulfatase
MFGNRGIYCKGWTAVTRHSTPWKMNASLPPFDEDTWELYGPDDWTQAHNLAAENPQKLADMQRLWLIEAVKYNVVPLDDRRVERLNPDLAGRPQLIRGNSQLLFPGMRISEACVVNLKNKSHTVLESGAAGVIVNQGGSVGGWSMYAHEGKLKYCYNFLGIELSTITAEEPLPAGKHQVRMAFAYDGGGLAKGGDITLYYDGKPVGTGRVERTQPMMYSSDEACDVGFDSGSPGSHRTTAPPATSSPARSTGCKSTSATTPKTTSSNRRTGSRSRWRGNSPDL